MTDLGTGDLVAGMHVQLRELLEDEDEQSYQQQQQHV